MVEINRAMGSLNKRTQEMAVCLAKIEQHLNDMNGTILRHQKNIERIDNEMKGLGRDISTNKVAMAKMMGAATVGSAGGGILISVILKFIGM